MFKLLAAAAVIALPVAAQAQSMSPTTFVTKAGASDLYEKQSSNLVLQTTHNPKVRSFAQDMIRDHTKSTNQVKQAAREDHVRVAPPALDAKGRRNVAALRAAHGTARDQLYIQQQRDAHQEALALHQGYAHNGSARHLKMAAANIAPVVEHHIGELRGL